MINIVVIMLLLFSVFIILSSVGWINSLVATPDGGAQCSDVNGAMIEGSFPGRALNPGPAPLAASSSGQTTNGRAPTTSRPPSGRVSLSLIGGKLLWERKFGKFHTSRSRAVRDINISHTQRAQQRECACAPGSCRCCSSL